MPKPIRLLLLLILIIIIPAIVLIKLKNPRNSDEEKETVDAVIKEYAYGFDLDSFQLEKDTILPNQFFAELLAPLQVPYSDVMKLAEESKDVFDIRYLRAGKPFTVLSKDSCDQADFFIYEPNPYEYIQFDLKNLCVDKIKNPVDTFIQTISGVIESSPWNALGKKKNKPQLIEMLEDAMAWSIDFHHVLAGDQFRMVYEAKYINGQETGVGRLIGAYYQTANNEYYSIRFKTPKYDGYYDEEGRPMKKAFLKAPVKYSRISSGYSRNRFHPVLKRNKAHRGTDYAAPKGTPIFSVADGVVTKATRSRNNGNYVKVKHDDMYSTQYLHMSGFAPGIKSGVHVKQGETIGYIGKTGLATGYHVCFRFWKNGREVNHLREKLPPPEPMEKTDLPEFYIVRDSVVQMLNQVLVIPKAQTVASDSLLVNNADSLITDTL